MLLVELVNSSWVSVEPWNVVKLRRHVVVRLVVQGKRYLRSALQLLEVVQLKCRLRVELGLFFLIPSSL